MVLKRVKAFHLSVPLAEKRGGSPSFCQPRGRWGLSLPRQSLKEEVCSQPWERSNLEDCRDPG